SSPQFAREKKANTRPAQSRFCWTCPRSSRASSAATSAHALSPRSFPSETLSSQVNVGKYIVQFQHVTHRSRRTVRDLYLSAFPPLAPPSPALLALCPPPPRAAPHISRVHTQPGSHTHTHTHAQGQPSDDDRGVVQPHLHGIHHRCLPLSLPSAAQSPL